MLPIFLIIANSAYCTEIITQQYVKDNKKLDGRNTVHTNASSLPLKNDSGESGHG